MSVSYVVGVNYFSFFRPLKAVFFFQRHLTAIEWNYSAVGSFKLKWFQSELNRRLIIILWGLSVDNERKGSPLRPQQSRQQQRRCSFLSPPPSYPARHPNKLSHTHTHTHTRRVKMKQTGSRKWKSRTQQKNWNIIIVAPSNGSFGRLIIFDSSFWRRILKFKCFSR